MPQLPIYYILELEISIGMRLMRKKLNIFMLKPSIYYILEWEIPTDANVNMAEKKRKK